MSKKVETPKTEETTKVDETSTTANTSDSTKPTEKTESSLSDGGVIAAASDEVVVEDNPAEQKPAEEGDKPAEEKPAEEKPAEVTIEPYELELSEESPITDEEFDEIVEFADKHKLTKTEAENLIKMRESSHEAAHKQLDLLQTQKIKTLQEEYKNDAELHTPANKNYIKQAVQVFGNDQEFKDLFKDPSMNYNTKLAKFLINVGKRVAGIDDTLGKGKSTAADKVVKDPVVEVAGKFYKGM